LIIKLTLRSQFKFKNRSKDKGRIFLKNIITFILFSRVFLKFVKISLFFPKNIKVSNSILKAPSRHKKFIHQLCFEYFTIHMNLFYINKFILVDKNLFFIKNLIDSIFLKIGSNILNRVKFILIAKTKLPNLKFFK